MARTTPKQVKEVLLGEYDGSSSLTVFIQLASSLADKVAIKDTGSILSANDLALLEALLAAHFYGLSEKFYAQKQTGRASATFQGKTDMGLDATLYGQMAKRLDTTGELARIDAQAKNGKRVAGLIWLGTNEGETSTVE